MAENRFRDHKRRELDRDPVGWSTQGWHPRISDPFFINDREPVIAVEPDGQNPCAYPIRCLTWHKIENDKIGTTLVAITFCPLCNSGITFDRRIKGKLRTFGVSGKLRNPHVNYDSSRKPFLYNGEAPPHGIPALAHMVRVGNRAWPASRLAGAGQVSEAGVTICWATGPSPGAGCGHDRKG